MALWQAGEYGLQSRDNVTSSNLSCIHVKLTDAALKVIEDLQNGNVGLSDRNTRKIELTLQDLYFFAQLAK